MHLNATRNLEPPLSKLILANLQCLAPLHTSPRTNRGIADSLA